MEKEKERKEEIRGWSAPWDSVL